MSHPRSTVFDALACIVTAAVWVACFAVGAQNCEPGGISKQEHLGEHTPPEESYYPRHTHQEDDR